MLLVSTLGKTFYFVGSYTNHKFKPETRGIIDVGHYYAARSMIDGRGRRILFAWITEGRSAAAQWASGWSGVQALPRVLSLGEDGKLLIKPIPELEMLR